eukprot:1715849-Prymnesium_polylepis.1
MAARGAAAAMRQQRARELLWAVWLEAVRDFARLRATHCHRHCARLESRPAAGSSRVAHLGPRRAALRLRHARRRRNRRLGVDLRHVLARLGRLRAERVHEAHQPRDHILLELQQQRVQPRLDVLDDEDLAPPLAFLDDEREHGRVVALLAAAGEERALRREQHGVDCLGHVRVDLQLAQHDGGRVLDALADALS